MNKYLTMIWCCAAMLLPATAYGQKNIEKAIDELAASSNVITGEEHSTQKDPKTGKMESKKDTYDFQLDATQTHWLDKLRMAFRQDRPDAYRERTVVGDSGNDQVPLYIENDVTFMTRNFMTRNYKNYIIMHFTVPGDTAMTMRYVCALGWKENESDKTITGTLHVYMSKNPRSFAKSFYPLLDLSRAEILPQAYGTFYPSAPHVGTLEVSKQQIDKTLNNLDMELDDKAWMERFDGYVTTINGLDKIELPFFPAKLLFLSYNKNKVSKDNKQKAIKSLKELQQKTKNDELKNIYQKAIDNLNQ